MKRLVSFLLLLITVLSLVASLASCSFAPYKKTESSFAPTEEDLIEYFRDKGYYFDGYRVSTYPDTDYDVYYMVEVMSNKASEMRYKYMHIAVCGAHNGAIQYCENHIDEKRTVIDELFEILATEAKPFSKYAVYGNLVIMYNYDSDYNDVVAYMRSNGG